MRVMEIGKMTIKKKGSYYLPEKTEKIVKSFWETPGQAIQEVVRLLLAEQKKIKIFTENEIDTMLAFSEGWIMDFSDIPPKEALLSNFEDFCRLALQVEAEKHMPDLYQKIQNLSQSQALAVARTLKFCLQQKKPADCARKMLQKQDIPKN